MMEKKEISSTIGLSAPKTPVLSASRELKGKKSLYLMVFFFSSLVFAQSKPSLQDFSQQVNKNLPESYDEVTKLVSTSVENNNFSYHFILKATQAEYKKAIPMVKRQIEQSACSQKREKTILLQYQANIIYRYENTRGETLGEFMISPKHCKK